MALVSIPDYEHAKITEPDGCATRACPAGKKTFAHVFNAEYNRQFVIPSMRVKDNLTFCISGLRHHFVYKAVRETFSITLIIVLKCC